MLLALPAMAQMRITEYMYGGTDGEFVEFTNVGANAIDMTGWSFDDDSRLAGTVDLSTFGSVAPGESVILTEATASAFRTSWSLCNSIKVVGSNLSANLGRGDEINLFDANSALVDRLTYGDQVFAGTIRTSGASGWVSAGGLGANTIASWTLSTVGNSEGSVASSGADIGSPGRSTRATVAFNACPPPVGVMRITEFMYSGANGEFVEFTNVGNAPLDLSGWSFDDDSRTAGTIPLGAFGTVKAGESVILTDATEAAFRSAWNLCSGIHVIGGNSAGLGRADEINLYNNSAVLIDRLTYNDQIANGGPRTQNISAWVSSAALGANMPSAWTLSLVGDNEGSVASLGADVASPGRSQRATIAYDPCVGSPGAPVVSVDIAATSLYLDLAGIGSGAVSGVIGDPTDPAATTGIGFTFYLPGGGDASALNISATSSNSSVVDATGLLLTGTGASRQLQIVPHGVGYSTITLSASDGVGNTGTYLISYAASAAALSPAATLFHTGASDASATVALDADSMIVADDETNVLRVYARNVSGLPLNGFDFSGQLALPDAANPEIDLEGSTRIGDRLFWTGSYSNSKSFHVRPNRHRVFATDLAGTGINASLSYVGRYDWLLEDLVAWDQANGHGLGVDALGFAASSADGVDSKTPAGFNIEGLGMAPDNTTAYFGFRAPQLPISNRHFALIVPVLNFDTLVTTAAPGSIGPGSATFGAPIFLDLGGRGIRSIDRNAIGQFLITAGPAGDATGIAPSDFRLFAWTGQPGDTPFDLGVNMTALDVNGGSFESIAEIPANLGAGSIVQFLFDNGDSVWYADGIAAKDLAESRFRKAASLKVAVDVSFPPATLAASTGTPQQAEVTEAFTDPLEVLVSDVYGHPVAGITVLFDAPASGATAALSATSAQTGLNGIASVTATANSTAGAYSVGAHINGVVAGADFTLTNVPGPSASIASVSGTPQSAVLGQPFAAALVVHVADAAGNPRAGEEVAFAAPEFGASADLSATSAMTDANGDASVTAIANALSGNYVVTASVAGLGATTAFALTNAVDAADRIYFDGFEATP